jgi:uncharacterized protein YhaN
MLSEVGNLPEQMTGGRYVSIRRRLDEAGTMFVEQVNGKLNTLNQLNTVTREQRYLASDSPASNSTAWNPNRCR